MVNGSIITNLGKNIFMNRAFKETPDYTSLTKFKVGYDNSTPSVSSTDLDYPVPISGTESVDDCDTADWNDSADMTTSLNSTLFKEGAGSLNLTKDGTASATATTSKTTTSVDFTSKELMVWLYVKDATAYAQLATTDAIQIRFGSDSSNYYVYTRDKADLAVGWNTIRFTTDTADSTTGSPTIAACDYSYIGITADAAATTWTAGAFIMDDWKVSSSDDFVGSTQSGFPSFDETNHEVETRSVLLTTHANGYLINGYAMFNDDTTKKMGSENTFTGDSKSDGDEFVFITTMRLI